MTGFRRNLYCQDSVLDLVSDVEDAAQRRRRTAVVFFDIKAAFDSVPINTVMDSLVDPGIGGKAAAFIHALLSNRSFRVRLGSTLSSPRPQNLGLPQGSILSPLLFNLVMAGLPKALPATTPPLQLSIYADDICLWTNGKDPWKLMKTIQKGVDVTTEYIRGLGLTPSAEKTRVMLLGSTANWCTLPEPILMENTPLEQVFLGSTHQGPPDQMQDNPERDQATQRTALRLPPEDPPDHPQSHHSRTDALRTPLRQAQQINAGIPGTAPPSRTEAGSRTPTWGAERRRLRRGCRSPSSTTSHPTPELNRNQTEQDNNRKGATAASKGPTTEPFFMYTFHAGPAVPAHPTSPQSRRSMETPRDRHPDNTASRPWTTRLRPGLPHPSNTVLLGRRIPGPLSSTDAELLAITEALDIIAKTSATKAVILTDSRGALSRLNNRYEHCPLSFRAHQKLQLLLASGLSIALQWIPSHKGIPGNEMADSLSKQATTKTLVRQAPSTTSQAKKSIALHVRSFHPDKHTADGIAPPPCITAGLTRDEASLLLRLRASCTFTRAYGFTIGLVDDPPCGTCSVQESVTHLLTRCRDTASQRDLLFQNLSSAGITDHSLVNLVYPMGPRHNRRRIHRELLQFLRTTGLDTRL
ncbi:uncharacterized protein LOC135384641 [Ornithodoros turicata]|uniref:uncharacterized protein LOC135384641 n=1 Tax=Ornithodoros turicata TaxID=34597 RepID=UPI0031386CFE